MPTRSLFPIIFQAVTIFFILIAKGFSYSPVLPKTSQTDSVIALDFGPLKESTLFMPALHTITSLQGMINRQSSTKILIKNLPIRVFRYPESDEYDFNGSIVGPGSPSDHWFEDGMIPYPVTEPVLNQNSEHPMLLWMLQNYSYLVKGKTVFTFEYSPSGLGSAAAAVNSCTFEDYLPVADRMVEWMESNGFNFETKYDLQHKNNVEALNWSINKYMDHPKRNNKWVYFYSSPAIMNDYVVATGTFTYVLEGRESHSELDELSLLPLVLNENNYPPGTVNIGHIEGPDIIQPAQELGYTAVAGQIPNASITSSIPTDPNSFTPAPTPKAREVDNNGLYVCFSGNDGDAIDFNLMIQYKNFRNDPNPDSIPFLVKFNPYFIDLFPTFYAWLTNFQRGNIDLVSSMNDGGASKTDAGKAGWNEQFSNYWNHNNGSWRMIHFFGVIPPRVYNKGTWANLASYEPDYIFIGYQQNHDKPDSRWIHNGRTALSNLIGYAGEPPCSTAVRVREAATTHAPVGEPVFVNIRLGTDEERRLNARRGSKPFTMAREVLDSLRNDPAITRNIHVLPGRDMVATYMKWQGAEINYSTTIIHQKPFQNGVYRSYDLMGRRFVPALPDKQISIRPKSKAAQ